MNVIYIFFGWIIICIYISPLNKFLFIFSNYIAPLKLFRLTSTIIITIHICFSIKHNQLFIIKQAIDFWSISLYTPLISNIFGYISKIKKKDGFFFSIEWYLYYIIYFHSDDVNKDIYLVILNKIHILFINDIFLIF